jgi:hypothetical protein
MNIVPLIGLGLGLLGIGYGLVTWRSGGRGIALAGAGLASSAAYIQLANLDSAARYAALAALAIIGFFVFMMRGRWGLRHMRIELTLIAATILAIWGSQFSVDGPAEIRVGLAILAGVLATLFVAVALIRFARLVRTGSRQNR